MQQAVDTCKLYNTNAKAWIGLWMAEDPPSGYTTQDVANWCRHDAYMGLIMGGKGVQIWSGSRGRTNFSDTYFDAYLGGYLSVAKELNGPLNLAPVFLYGQPKTNVTLTITAGPKQLDLVYQKSMNSYSSVTFLAVQHEGTNYLFAVNSAEVPVTARFSGLPSAIRTDLFEGDDTRTPDGAFKVTFAPLAVKGWRFAPLGDAVPLNTLNNQGRSTSESVRLN